MLCRMNAKEICDSEKYFAAARKVSKSGGHPSYVPYSVIREA